MSGKSSQRKGREGELELCRIFRAHGIPAEPGQAVSYGTTPDIMGVAGIHCEVKRCEQLRLDEWLSQAIRDSEKFNDGIPVLFHRRNRKEWLCTMRLSDWLGLYNRQKAAETAEERGDMNIST